MFVKINTASSLLDGLDFSPVASFCQFQTWLVLNQTAQKETVHYMFTVFLCEILTEAGEIIIIISMFDHFLSMVSFSGNFWFVANLNDVNVSLMSFLWKNRAVLSHFDLPLEFYFNIHWFLRKDWEKWVFYNSLFPLQTSKLK